MAEQTVTLQPGESKLVNFQAIPHEARVYQVSVDGLTGSFAAIEPPVPEFAYASDLEVRVVDYPTPKDWKWTVSVYNKSRFAGVLHLVKDARLYDGSTGDFSAWRDEEIMEGEILAGQVVEFSGYHKRGGEINLGYSWQLRVISEAGELRYGP